MWPALKRTMQAARPEPLDSGGAILRGMPPTWRDWLGALLLTTFLVVLVVLAVLAAVPA